MTEQYELLLQAHKKMTQRTPELDRMAAICCNELAFHTHVPAQNWEKAEYHYRKAIELAEGIPDPVEAANMELNLIKMYHISGRPVDVNTVKELIKILEDAGDARAEKKRVFLEELGQD